MIKYMFVYKSNLIDIKFWLRLLMFITPLLWLYCTLSLTNGTEFEMIVQLLFLYFIFSIIIIVNPN